MPGEEKADEAARARLANWDPTSARIDTSTQVFVARLAVAEQLLASARNARDFGKPTAVERAAARSLGGRRRSEIEADVLSMLARLPQLTLEALDRVLEDLGGLDAPVETAEYPIAVEEGGALLKFLLNNGVADQAAQELLKWQSDEPALVHALATIRRQVGESPLEVQGRALLPLLVTYFEEFLAALVRTGLSHYPRALGEPQPVPWDVIEQYAGRESLERYSRDGLVDRFMRNSPDDWAKRLNRWSGIDFVAFGSSWESVREAIARRHIVVHAGGNADAGYRTAVRGTRFSEAVSADFAGLSCPPEYMLQVIDDMFVFGISLALKWADFLGARSPLTALSDLVSYIYKLESNGNWAAARSIANYAMTGFHNQGDADRDDSEVLRVNWWLCRQRMGEVIDGEVAAWRPMDLEMRAAKAALLGDYPSLGALIRELRASTRPFRMREIKDQVIFREAAQVSGIVRDAFAGAPSGRRARRRGR